MLCFDPPCLILVDLFRSCYHIWGCACAPSSSNSLVGCRVIETVFLPCQVFCGGGTPPEIADSSGGGRFLWLPCDLVRSCASFLRGAFPTFPGANPPPSATGAERAHRGLQQPGVRLGRHHVCGLHRAAKPGPDRRARLQLRGPEVCRRRDTMARVFQNSSFFFGCTPRGGRHPPPPRGRWVLVLCQILGSPFRWWAPRGIHDGPLPLNEGGWLWE